MTASKRFIILFLLWIPSLVNAQVQHAEPLNWWVGMKSDSLQLMINGPGLGETTPVIRL
jgi:hypothetical protein